MVRTFVLMLFVGLTPVWAAGQLPEFYDSVDALVWVVDDVDRAVEGWTRLGFEGIQRLGVQQADQGVLFRGEAVVPRYEMAMGRLGETAVYWLCPKGGEEAIAEFYGKHGSGVFSLMHRVPSLEMLDQEIGRLGALGIKVLQSAEIPTADGLLKYVFFDTEAEGKYVLGLFAGHLEGSPLDVPVGSSPSPRISQFAFAVRNLEPVSDFWAHLGFPAFVYSHPETSELRYKDGPGDFDMRLGWQRHGKVPYEWIQSFKGPNVYLDHLAKHGEGVHHIAFNVEDMDAAVSRWQRLGFAYSMGGAWGEKGKPGSGRFVYVDTQAIGGTDVELLWNFKPAGSR